MLTRMAVPSGSVETSLDAARKSACATADKKPFVESFRTYSPSRFFVRALSAWRLGSASEKFQWIVSNSRRM